jgi:HlyD family secretion protein
VKKRRSWVIGFFVLVALGVILTVSFRNGKPIRVRTAHLERGPVEDLVVSNSVGSVEPLKSAVLSAEIVGKIDRIHVREGPVKAGRTVVEIGSRDLEAEREVTCRDIDTARARIGQATLRKKKVSEDLERLRKVDVPKGDVERLERDLEIAVADEEIAGRQIKTLEAQLDVLSLKLAKTKVAAPFDGTVVRLHSEEGESVTPGKTLFTVHSADPLLVRAPIDEVDMGRLALGQKVKLSFDGYEGREFEGTLHEIMPSASTDQKNNRTVDVKIRAELPPNVLAGMSANVQIVVGRKDDALRLATHLVRDDRVRGGKYVLLMEGGFARRREVTLGVHNWNVAEIASGLAPADAVIVPLQFGDEPAVKEGAKVILFDAGK